MTALPGNLSNPARQALDAIGCTTLEQAAELGTKELLKLHGVGPKTIRQLREVFAEQGFTFSDERK
ncbi:MAG: hypothetical protein HOV79_01610 [Hamadaea sp.]|nr:hypothetical protein [Hamadaea sp.]